MSGEEASNPGQAMIYLVSLFGTVITLLLGVIGFMLNRWVTRLDTRMDSQDAEISDLKVVTGQHTTEIKNLHHRIKTS